MGDGYLVLMGAPPGVLSSNSPYSTGYGNTGHTVVRILICFVYTCRGVTIVLLQLLSELEQWELDNSHHQEYAFVLMESSATIS